MTDKSRSDLHYTDAKAPAACANMDDVRAGVDALDRELVRLIAIRQGYMEAAARIKTGRDKVRDEWRIEDVVSKVLDACAREGLSTALAEPVWREMIERCIAHELAVWDATRENR